MLQSTPSALVVAHVGLFSTFLVVPSIIVLARPAKAAPRALCGAGDNYSQPAVAEPRQAGSQGACSYLQLIQERVPTCSSSRDMFLPATQREGWFIDREGRSYLPPTPTAPCQGSSTAAASGMGVRGKFSAPGPGKGPGLWKGQVQCDFGKSQWEIVGNNSWGSLAGMLMWFLVKVAILCDKTLGGLLKVVHN